MLIISGLLTLLVVSHAGCAGIKGGLHTKGGRLTQEQVAQEDIPAPYSIKTGPVFGTKVTTGDADGRIKEVMSKKAPSPALHHSVKTAVDRTSKTHPVPGLHHAATSPVAQDQVLIDDSAVATSGIKTIKTATSGKTRFSQSDSQVRDPVARPVVQTIKTVHDPATDSSQSVKSLKTIGTGKTRFSEQDKQQRDPTARPIIQTFQSTDDSPSDTTKTLKTVTRGKTRFSQGDTQVRDPVARPVIQTVKTDQDSFAVQQTVKTPIKTETSDIRRKTVKSSQNNFDSASASSVPESIVEVARRNTLRISVPDSELAGNQGISAGSTNVQGMQLLSNLESQTQSGFGRVIDKGEITLNEETIRSLQNAGSILRENGEISLNEDAIRLLQNAGGSSIDPSSIFLRSNPNQNSAARTPTSEISGLRRITYATTGDERQDNTVVTRPQIRTQALGQTARVSSQNQRQSTRTRITGVQNNNNLMNSRTQNTQTTQRGNQINTSGQILRSPGATGIRQSTTTTNAEKIIFNGKEINIAGLTPGQIFDENLQPILTDKAEISRRTDIRISSTPETRQPITSSRVTQTAGVSSFTSGTGSLTRTSSGATRRRQQAVTTTRDKVQLRTPARQPISSVVQTGTSSAGSRSQGAAGIRTTTGSQETILFNGKEISIGGLQAGQMFDENLQPIMSDRGAISGQANTRASPIPQIPQAVRSTGVTQTAGVSSFTSGTGSLRRTSSGATRRRQQAVTTTRDKVQLRTPARQPISSVVQTGTSSAGLRSQGAAGIRQSTTTGSQETILFNGKEISVGGLQAGQMFDENLQPILSDRGAISGQANTRASPVPQIPQAVRSAGVTQTAGVSSFTSGTGSLRRTSSGETRRRQQAVTTTRDKVQLRTPARQPISSVVQTGTSSAGLRSQGAAGIRQSTTTGSQETILFNGKEISVGGLQAGQMFDENLQPILSDRGAISGQANTRASPVPQIPQAVRSAGVTETAGVSSFTSGTGSLRRTSSGETRQRQQAVTTTRDKVQLRTPARQPISSVVQTGTSSAGLRSQGAAGIRQSTTTGSQETILFNGKEISVGGLQAGQIFDENLQPILSDRGAISGQANTRASPVPQIPQAVRSAGVTQTAGVSSFTSGTGSLRRTSSGETRRRQQAVTTTRDKVQLRTPARQPISSVVQTGTSSAGMRSQGAAGIRQSTTTGSQETILFNGKEISVGGLQAGQMFDENLQPILSDRGAISGQANLRASPVPQIPQPVRSAGVTQTAGVSSFTSGTGSLRRTSSGETRRRQQAVTTTRDKVQLRTPARQPISSVVQTGTSSAGLRSQGAAGIRQSTTTGSQETILFNGKEISVGGLQAGQMFDENLQPILSDRGAISGQAITRASPVPQIPQAVRSAGVTQTAGVSSFTSGTGSLRRTSSGETRRRQQAVTSTRDKVQLRTPARQPISSVVQTGTSSAGMRSQGAAGIRQSTTTGSQETILFNGKEISVGGLQAGQMFDENLQPILSDRGAMSGQANLRASPVPQIPQPVRSTGVTQTAGVSSFTSGTGSLTRTFSGATRRRQQAVTTTRDKVQLRTPARQPISSVVQTGTSSAGLRSQGAAGIRQSTTTGSQETILFNGKEISVGGLQAGQMFDENLQPILSDRGAISGQANTRASPVPQIPQAVRSAGVTQTAGVSSFTSSTGSLTRTSSGATRRRQQAVTTTRDKVQLRTPARQPISSVVQTGTSSAGMRSQGAAGIRQSTTTGSQETILFNGKEISVGGLQAGQMFDENLQPILSDRGAVSGQANLRTSPVPEIPQPVRSTGVTQTAGVSSFTSGTGSLRRTSSRATRRRQQAVTTTRDKLQLRTPARQPISSVVQTGTSSSGLRSQGAAGIRTTTGSQETILFNGKEISVGGLQAGQMFDENLQPILSDRGAVSGQANLRTSPVPQIPQPVRSTGVTQTAGISSFTSGTGSLTRTPSGLTDRDRKPTDASVGFQSGSVSGGSGLRASGLPRRQFSSRPIASGNRGQSSLVSAIPNSGTISNTETVLFNGKEISIGGLREGQLFDEILRPIMGNTDDINVAGRIGLAERTLASGLRTGVEPQRSSPASARRSGGLRGDSLSYVGSSRSSSSQSTSSGRLGLTEQNLYSRGADNSGILQLNAGDIAYTSDRGSKFQRKISQDRITQEISQDRVETPVIQEKQEIRVVPKLKVEDTVEQTSLTNPALKTVQVQETVPFTISRTPSKSSFTKISQVSQKNIDIPTVQQQVMPGEFSGYLPKKSFLPPFNYGVPVVSASKYTVKSPIVQEQQKVEQEFV